MFDSVFIAADLIQELDFLLLVLKALTKEVLPFEASENLEIDFTLLERNFFYFSSDFVS